MDRPSLIVRADGFGLCHAANQAVEEAFETGVLTCASLAPVGPWVPEAAALAAAHAEWEVGVELWLHADGAGCRWGPAAGAAAVPSLVGPTGRFGPALPADADPEHIRIELLAQIEQARAWGVHPAYLEYTGPPRRDVAQALHSVSQQLGIPADMAAWGVQPIPLAGGGAETAAAALRQTGPATYLWVTRPAHSSPETWALWGDGEAQARAVAAAALCDPAVRTALTERGIELVSFGQYLETRLGADPAE